LLKQDGDRNAAVSAGQSSRCRLMLKRPHSAVKNYGIGNLTMEELWTAESTWEPQGEEAATRQEHTG
ncbi:hypothetical protein T03_2459, partial [Trichinella britovi]